MTRSPGALLASVVPASSGAHLGLAGLVDRPRLLQRLGAARVSVVSAPADNGKTPLLRFLDRDRLGGGHQNWSCARMLGAVGSHVFWILSS